MNKRRKPLRIIRTALQMLERLANEELPYFNPIVDPLARRARSSAKHALAAVALGDAHKAAQHAFNAAGAYEMWSCWCSMFSDRDEENAKKLSNLGNSRGRKPALTQAESRELVRLFKKHRDNYKHHSRHRLAGLAKRSFGLRDNAPTFSLKTAIRYIRASGEWQRVKKKGQNR